MIPFPEYIKTYKAETIQGIIKHCQQVLKETSRGGLKDNTRTKLADCERELERRKEDLIYE